MGRRSLATRGRAVASAVAVALAATLLVPAPQAAAADPFAIDVSVAGANGVGRSFTPGRPCAEGGDGAYWHYDYGGALPGGAFGAEASDLRFHLDLHSDVVTAAQPGVPQPTGERPTAFLLGHESHASLINKRGTIKVRLASGDCENPSLAFDGTTVNGAGTWSMGDTSGAYRQATGAGSFGVTADVAPGADNPFALRLDGAIEILKPSLKVEVLGSYWGFMGLDYALRRVTVIYRITNAGPGDAFGTRLLNATSPTAGVTPRGPVPQHLGDLLEGQSATVRLQYDLGLLEPCQLVILNCNFQSTLHVNMPDALDRPATHTATVGATAPALPPPL